MPDLDGIREQLLECLASAGVDDMRPTAKGHRGTCPHCGKPDRFIISERDDGDGYQVKCHAHCEQRDVLDALELSWRDLRLSAASKEREDELHPPDTAVARPIEWAWQDRIPLGRLSLVVGNEGTGKGTMIASLVARFTHGTLPGDLKGPITVAVIGSEDLLNDVWTPRLYLANADLSHVLFQQKGDFEIDFTDPGDINHLRSWIRRYSLKVVIFDALLDHLGGPGVDEFKPKAVRGALAPIRRLAGEEEIAVLGSMHPRKGKVFSFRELVANSHQFNAVSRSSLLLAPHPDDPEWRVLAFGKGNHAGMVPTLKFRVEVVHFELNGYSFRDVRAVDWDVADVDLDEAIRASTGARSSSTKTEAAEEAIVEALEQGPRLASEVKAEVVQKVGCGDRTFYRAAADLREDGVLGCSGETSATTWFLLSSAHPTTATGESIHGGSSCESSGEGAETPVTTGVSADQAPPSELLPPSMLSPVAVVDGGSGDSGNSFQSDAELVRETLRRRREARSE
jgi:putative DNA primase/helicase